MTQPHFGWEERRRKKKPYPWKLRREAEAAAKAMAERGPLVPPSEELAKVRALLEGHTWIFARTMADNPHWYTLRWTWEANPLLGEAPNEDFVWVVKFIRQYGYVERFPDPVKGWPYVMMNIGNFKHWTMGARCEPGPYNRNEDTILINRKPLPRVGDEGD
jgi:hypothetical protein